MFCLFIYLHLRATVNPLLFKNIKNLHETLQGEKGFEDVGIYMAK